ncbi:MAG: Tm-1-like ATP-binding domain-containing protein [Rhodobacteraceae bacterium]|nr:Tm-1-like ATP-binding domain-containing protein [Paracoccaceae bacterium]
MTSRAHEVILLATLNTKSSEACYLKKALEDRHVHVNMVDISLSPIPDAVDHKQQQIESAAAQALATIAGEHSPDHPVVGLGGGTGGDIILRIMQSLPMEVAKIIISPLPFDPRAAAADNFIVMIPTVVDLEGLNGTVRSVLGTAAEMIAGLVAGGPVWLGQAGSIGMTTLGVTRKAAQSIINRLQPRGYEVTTFHANGFGGAAFARFAREGRLAAAIDMTIHEMTRIQLAGDHAPMPDRFRAAGSLPRIVLPGGLNFLGLGPLDQIKPAYRRRPHYRHSGHFTHVKLTPEEMTHVASALAAELNEATGKTLLILPMGGFSHEDRPGGAIEDAALRETSAECLEAAAIAYDVQRIDSHINDSATAEIAVRALLDRQQGDVP